MNQFNQSKKKNKKSSFKMINCKFKINIKMKKFIDLENNKIILKIHPKVILSNKTQNKILLKIIKK